MQVLADLADWLNDRTGAAATETATVIGAGS
jgi:hypothetical protein